VSDCVFECMCVCVCVCLSIYGFVGFERPYDPLQQKC
jgi:hypothetical protein